MVRPRANCSPFLLEPRHACPPSPIKYVKFPACNADCHIPIRVSHQPHLSFSSLLFALSLSASWLTRRYAFKFVFLVFVLWVGWDSLCSLKLIWDLGGLTHTSGYHYVEIMNMKWKGTLPLTGIGIREYRFPWSLWGSHLVVFHIPSQPRNK